MALANDYVSHTVAVKRNRARNVDTDRLLRRWFHLVAQVFLHSRQYSTRHNWVVRAAEMSAIQRVLVDRGVPEEWLDFLRDEVASISPNL